MIWMSPWHFGYGTARDVINYSMDINHPTVELEVATQTTALDVNQPAVQLDVNQPTIELRLVETTKAMF